MIQDVIENTQRAAGSQTTVLVIATISVLAVLAWEFFTKIFPTIRDAMHRKFKREQTDSQQQKSLDGLEEFQRTAQEKSEETERMLKGMEEDIRKIHMQMKYLAETNQLLLQGMLDMLMCMEGSREPTECARNAIGKINRFLVKNSSPIQ